MSQNTNVAALAVLGLIAITASYQRSPQALSTNIVTPKPKPFNPDPDCKWMFVTSPMNVREKLTSQ